MTLYRYVGAHGELREHLRTGGVLAAAANAKLRSELPDLTPDPRAGKLIRSFGATAASSVTRGSGWHFPENVVASGEAAAEQAVAYYSSAEGARRSNGTVRAGRGERNDTDELRRRGLDQAVRAALETVAANARPRYSPMPPMPLGIRPIGEYDSALRLGYPRLAARAKHDPAARKQFNNSNLWLDGDPAEARAILREHPQMNSWIFGSGKDEAVKITILNGTRRAELTWLVSCLAKLSVMEGGEADARRLHEFLTAAANARIPANEIIVVHGLIVAGRVDLGSGAYLVPYEDVRIEFDLPDEPEPFQKKPLRTPPRSCAASNSDPASDYRRRTTACRTCGSSTASRPTTESTLRVGSRMPSFSSTCSRLRCGRRCCPARVTCSYPHGYRKSTQTSGYPNQISGGFVSDVWPEARDLSRSGAVDFVALARDWYAEPQKPHALALATRRLAASLSRPGGRFGVEDRILDVAIALEICYGGKKGHQLAKRAARLLGADVTEQIRSYDQARRFYSVRSRIVHTDGPAPARDSLHGELQAGRDLACRSLRDLLKCDMPVDWAQVRPYLERKADEYVERAKHRQYV